MKRPRRVDIDWPDLMRAFERFDPTYEDEPLPYLNLRSGKVSYFGLNQDVDYLDTLDFDRYVALSLPSEFPPERRARMRAFAATVAQQSLSELLREALAASRGVLRFYETLEGHPSELARWRRAEGPRTQDILDAWVLAENLIVQRPAPWA